MKGSADTEAGQGTAACTWGMPVTTGRKEKGEMLLQLSRKQVIGLETVVGEERDAKIRGSVGVS